VRFFYLVLASGIIEAVIRQLADSDILHKKSHHTVRFFYLMLAAGIVEEVIRQL